MSKITDKDMVLLTYDTYEDYLDNFRIANDFFYLRDSKFTRMIAELGFRGGTVLSKKEFIEKRKLVEESLSPPKITSFFFNEKHIFTNPILRELAIRQIANYHKIISTIIFVCYKEKHGFDISGYIDFEDSLRKAHANIEGALDWKGVFAGKKKIVPKRFDLSYHNWRDGKTYYNNSSNYEAIFQKPSGIYFKYRGDRKLICASPWSRDVLVNRSYFFFDPHYYIVTYDYIIRKKI